jgi:hypothetical protein
LSGKSEPSNPSALYSVFGATVGVAIQLTTDLIYAFALAMACPDLALRSTGLQHLVGSSLNLQPGTDLAQGDAGMNLEITELPWMSILCLTPLRCLACRFVDTGAAEGVWEPLHMQGLDNNLVC